MRPQKWAIKVPRPWIDRDGQGFVLYYCWVPRISDDLGRQPGGTMVRDSTFLVSLSAAATPHWAIFVKIYQNNPSRRYEWI